MPTKVRTFAQQKAGLTRAIKKAKATNDGIHLERECFRTVAEWESEEWAQAHRVRRGAWPDDWARWQRALDDFYGPFADCNLDRYRP
jgi:hypothetical protein